MEKASLSTPYLLQEFEISLQHSDANLLITAKYLSNNTVYSKQILDDEVQGLTVSLFSNTRELYTGLLDALNASYSDIQISMSKEGKLTYSCKAGIGSQQRMFEFFIDLENQDLTMLKKIEKQLQTLSLTVESHHKENSNNNTEIMSKLEEVMKRLEALEINAENQARQPKKSSRSTKNSCVKPKAEQEEDFFVDLGSVHKETRIAQKKPNKVISAHRDYQAKLKDDECYYDPDKERRVFFNNIDFAQESEEKDVNKVENIDDVVVLKRKTGPKSNWTTLGAEGFSPEGVKSIEINTINPVFDTKRPGASYYRFENGNKTAVHNGTQVFYTLVGEEALPAKGVHEFGIRIDKCEGTLKAMIGIVPEELRDKSLGNRANCYWVSLYNNYTSFNGVQGQNSTISANQGDVIKVCVNMDIGYVLFRKQGPDDSLKITGLLELRANTTKLYPCIEIGEPNGRVSFI